MKYVRMPIEVESPEERGYHTLECNLSESSVTDLNWLDIKFPNRNFPLCYSDHRGKPELRELIAGENGVKAEDVLLVPGAAAALFIVATSVLNVQSRLIVEFPNYGTNIATPQLLGCRIDKLDLLFEEEFKPDFYKLRSMLKTKASLLSITKPHNPTGTVLSNSEAEELIDMCTRTGTRLLVDETYRDVGAVEKLPLFASVCKGAVSVSSLSKAYGLPGIRLGWIICRDKELMNTFLAAKEQIIICNSILDEEVAFHFMLNKTDFTSRIHENVKTNFILLKDWMQNQNWLEWVEPSAGVVCYPRINANIDLKRFYNTLLNDFKTMVGPGHWFDQSDRFFRLGYGWPQKSEFIKGLQNLEQVAALCQHN